MKKDTSFLYKRNKSSIMILKGEKSVRFNTLFVLITLKSIV